MEIVVVEIIEKERVVDLERKENLNVFIKKDGNDKVLVEEVILKVME